MRVRLTPIVDADHEDFSVIKAIEAELLKRGGGLSGIRRDVPQLIRRALDEVIDASRTGRLTVDQLEKTEKT